MPPENQNEMSVRNFFIAPVITAIVLLQSCAGDSSKNITRKVITTSPDPLGVESTMSLSGKVAAADEISVGFKTPGQIVQIKVKEGDYVKEGQLIAKLDDVDYKLQWEACDIQCRQLRDEISRMEKLHEKQAVSDNDFEKAKAGLEQAEVQLQSYKNQLDYTVLYAPTDGYVQSVNFAVSEMVDAGTPVITLLDVKQLSVEVNLPAVLYQQREKIGEITCTATAVRGVTAPMKLLSITPKADGTQLYKMKLLFADRSLSSQLTDGMNVEVKIQMLAQGNEGVYKLPIHTIFNEEGTVYVWVLDSSMDVHKKAVNLEGMDNDGSAIISGLDGDEVIVRSGVDRLHEGQHVAPMEEPSEANVGGLL